MQKDWLIIFEVKVTFRAHMIKIWWFLLYFNCWSFCNQTWFDSTSSKASATWSVRKLDCCVQGQGHSEGLNVSECLLGWYIQNRWTFCYQLGMVMHHHGQDCPVKRWFSFFKGKLTVRAHIIRYDCFYHIYGTAVLYSTRFNWMVHYHKLECLV